MINKKRIAAFAAASVTAFSVPCTAEAAGTHTVYVIGFDGNVIDTIKVNDGASLDLSGIDTAAMTKNTDDYTQIGFSSWSNYPDRITQDIKVYALYVEMKISCTADPERTEYYATKGDINTRGLEVSIAVRTQTPEMDQSGNFIISEDIVPIQSGCTASPATLDEAFAGGKTRAAVNIYPPNSKRAITKYNIYYYPDMGDANMDGYVNSSDASVILMMYSDISTTGTPFIPSSVMSRCDVDRNGKLDASDASYVLMYYSKASTGDDSITWEDIIEY